MGQYVAFGKRYPIENLHPRTSAYDSYSKFCKITDKIVWRLGVLREDAREGTVVTLLCEEIVKCTDLEFESFGVWTRTSLRDWLCSENGFMSYFTAEEKNKMIGYSLSWQWENPPCVGDKAFILSGGGEWGLSSSGNKSYEQQIDDFILSYKTELTNADRVCLGAFYWTRTRREPAIVWAVRWQGDFCDNNLSDGMDHFGLRPAIKIDTASFQIVSGEGTLEHPYLVK